MDALTEKQKINDLFDSYVSYKDIPLEEIINITKALDEIVALIKKRDEIITLQGKLIGYLDDHIKRIVEIDILEKITALKKEL